MKEIASFLLNRVISRVLTVVVLIGGIVLAHFLLKATGKTGRWECLTMFFPAVLFALWGWLRFRSTQRFPLAEMIWTALLSAFGCMVLWRG